MYLPPYQQLLRATHNEPNGEQATDHVTIPFALFKFLLQAALSSADFDEEAYLAANAEVRDNLSRAGNITPHQHFVWYGYFEGRRGGLPKVDEPWYLATYSDVAAGIPNRDIASATEHFEQVGAAEGRAPSLEYVDEANEWKQILDCKEGHSEGRTLARGDEMPQPRQAPTALSKGFGSQAVGPCLPFKGILHWNEESDAAVAQIERDHRPFKILLKTKDDPEMLRDWITHHQKIVEIGGLIILDNMSSDPRVSEVYAGLDRRCPIIRFSGFLDNVHNTDHFSKLYQALRASCAYFTFLDTDERLTLFDGEDYFRADPSLIAFLEARASTNIFPGTWLENITGYRDRFSLYHPELPLTHGLKWGKPIISSSCNFGGLINHNIQIEHSLYSGPLFTNFFVLHLSRVSNQQRIHSNLQKLKAFQVLPQESGVDDVLRRPLEEWDHIPDTLKVYVQQIFEMHEEGSGFIGDTWGSIQIAEDGRLICSEDWQKQAMVDFVSGSGHLVSEFLSA